MGGHAASALVVLCRQLLPGSDDGGHELFEFGDHLRIGVGEVVRFTRVGGEIVEFLDFRPVLVCCVVANIVLGFEVFPFVPSEAVCLVEEGRAGAHRFCSAEELGLIDAIDDAVAGDIKSSEVREGRQEVEGGEQGARLSAGGNGTGPPHNAGDADARFVAGAFSCAERAGIPPEDGAFRVAFLVVGVGGLIPWAVIAGVDDEGVVPKIEVVEGVEESAGFVVEFLDDITIEVALRGAAKLRRGIDDGVHHGVGQIEDEGLFRIPFLGEIIDRLVGIKARQGGHVAGLAGRLIIFVESNPAAIVGAEGAEIVIEPLGEGHAVDDGLAVRDIPFADAGGLVSGLPDQFGPGEFRGGHAPAFAADWVAAGKESRAGRTADGLGIEVGELGALRRELIEARGLVRFGAETGEVGIALIIGEDDQDVGFRWGELGGGDGGQSEE